MSKAKLFQKSILDFYVEKQDLNLINERWIKFQVFLKKKEKIKTWIETDYQVGFLEDIFENCLGYISKTQSPDEHFTLDREKKNEGNAQKADGALIVDTKVIAVIELKDQKTENLDKKYSREESAVRQAFGYLNNQPSAKYVIVSNFNELRFYFQKADKYEKFMLFDLDFEGFKKLHTLLSYESISKGIPYEIKKKSINFEEEISDNLYKDYTKFRTKLFENIVKNNLTIDKVKLLALTQKLIDRIIFILFAEDTQILPLNTIQSIITNHDKNIINDSSLYDFYKIYFQAIDKGNRKLNISAYNGGLFAKDNLLDSLIIDDNVLDEQAKVLSAYNFGSDISVNILGHIFEKSITALEEITAQIHDNSYDKKKSQQKVDGAFYTPEYITKYILDNTLGKLCRDKKTKLNIESIKSPSKIGKLTKKENLVLKSIYIYRDWLLNIKILDPACGSGAFLNQALEFLLVEHKLIDADRRLYENEGLSLYDIKSNILQNNLYGVDINEGAVEIAKLSLWLRTATKGEPLTRLAEKIKVGNSLISDKNIVDNAFNWEKEFPEVFEQGGFDVIIGNPPYVTFALGSKQNFDGVDIEYYKSKFPLSSVYKVSSYLIFMEMSLSLLSKNGLLSFIVPNSLYTNYYYSKFREFLINTYSIHHLYNLDYEVFDNVTIGGFSIFIFGNNEKQNTTLRVAKDIQDFYTSSSFNMFQDDFKKLPDNKFLFSKNFISLWNKSFKESISLSSSDFQFYNGIKTGNNKKFLSETKLDNRYKKIIRGGDFYKYTPLVSQMYVLFDPKQLWSNTKESMFTVDEKLIIRRTSDHLVITYDNQKNYPMDTTHLLYNTNDNYHVKYLLVVLLSKLMDLLYKTIVPRVGQAFAEVKIVNLKQLPIKNIAIQAQVPFIKKADLMLELNSKLQKVKQDFIKMLELIKTPKKLQNFEELEFDDFIKEYKKAKKLKFDTKIEERKLRTEWEDLFENDKKDALDLKSQIDRTNEEIDTMVYRLYGLSLDEIKIVEDAT